MRIMTDDVSGVYLLAIPSEEDIIESVETPLLYLEGNNNTLERGTQTYLPLSAAANTPTLPEKFLLIIGKKLGDTDYETEVEVREEDKNKNELLITVKCDRATGAIIVESRELIFLNGDHPAEMEDAEMEEEKEQEQEPELDNQPIGNDALSIQQGFWNMKL